MRHEFLIPYSAIRDFEAALSRVNRFAVKRGLDPVSAEIRRGEAREELRQIRTTTLTDATGPGVNPFRIDNRHVAVRVVPVVLEVSEALWEDTGYKPVAVLLPTEERGRWDVKFSPAVKPEHRAATLEKSHQAACKCENCKKPLSARVVIIEDTKTNRLIESGTECSAYYLGKSYDKQIAALEFQDLVDEFVNQRRNEFGDGMYVPENGYGVGTADLEEYVAAAHAAVRLFGYAPKVDRASPELADNSTWALTSRVCGLRAKNAYTEPEKKEQLKAAVGAEDHVFAKLAVAAWAAMPEEAASADEFAAKLKDIATQGWVSERASGIVVGAVGARIREAQRIATAATSRHLGKPGERLDFTLTFKGKNVFETSYGMMGIHRFQDAEGNVLVWKTAPKEALVVGQSYRVKGTVSEHDDYRGTKQTNLSRCKIELAPEVRRSAESEMVAAAGAGDTDKVDRLAAIGVSINCSAPEPGRGVTAPVTPIIAAVRGGHRGTADRIAALGADLRRTNAANMTPDGIAAANGDMQLAASLAAAAEAQVASHATRAPLDDEIRDEPFMRAKADPIDAAAIVKATGRQMELGL